MKTIDKNVTDVTKKEKHYAFDVVQIENLIKTAEGCTHLVIHVSLPQADISNKPGTDTNLMNALESPKEIAEALVGKEEDYTGTLKARLDLRLFEGVNNSVPGYVCPNPPGYGQTIGKGLKKLG